MIKVKATNEGLFGKKTAIGFAIDRVTPFVALPSHEALRLWVMVRNPANNNAIRALVLDVGPWNEHDNNYVFNGARPQAETGIDLFGRTTNKAGIDLGQRVWLALGMTDNGFVEWEFI